MKKTVSQSVLSCLALIALIVPSISYGQEIETGTWTGYIIPPDGQQMPVTYEVTMKSDSLAITVVQAQIGAVPFSNIEVSDDGLTFEWAPGTQLFCDLKLTANGGYDGECAPDGGDSGVMVMNRPKKTN